MIKKIKFSFLHLFYLFFFMFLINRLFFFSSGITERTCSYVSYPFLKVQQIVVYPFQLLIIHFQNIASLQSELKQLKQQNQDFYKQLVEQKSVQDFYEQSKEVVEFSKRYLVDTKLLAHVMLKIIGEKEDSIMIDVGSKHGVQKDDVVVCKNMLIGRVVELYPWYSKVALITDKRCKVSGQCKKDVTGICCGKNNQQLEFNFVPHFKDVKIGDIIMSTGQGLVYPKGFGLGKVITIESDNVSHNIQATPLFDIADLEYVYVLHK